MATVAHDPSEGIYPTDNWVHAMEVRDPQRFVFVSGTMGLDAAGRPGDSLEEQLELVWSNIRTILASAGMTAARPGGAWTTHWLG